MLRWMRTSRAQTGKFLEALAYAKEIAGVAEKVSDVPKVAVYADAFGDYGTIRWIVDVEDYVHFEKVNRQLFENAEYRAKLAEAPHFLMDGSTRDVMLKLV
jgi:hypothetical protein